MSSISRGAAGSHRHLRHPGKLASTAWGNVSFKWYVYGGPVGALGLLCREGVVSTGQHVMAVEWNPVVDAAWWEKEMAALAGCTR